MVRVQSMAATTIVPEGAFPLRHRPPVTGAWNAVLHQDHLLTHASILSEDETPMSPLPLHIPQGEKPLKGRPVPVRRAYHAQAPPLLSTTPDIKYLH